MKHSLSGVMEDDTQGKSLSCAKVAYAMLHRYLIKAFSSLCRAMIDRKDDAFSLSKRYDLYSRLHARTLLGEDKLSSFEIFFGPAQEKGNLEREEDFSV